MNLNLNHVKVPDEGDGIPQTDFSCEVGDTSVYFKNLKRHLLRHISEADAVVGCVAWLTDFDILDSLAKKECSIVVQKEDLWRPDIGFNSYSKQRLSEKYRKLSCNLVRFLMPGVMPSLSFAYDPAVDPLRCVGTHNSERKPAAPRAHHKFVVFCRLKQVCHESGSEGPELDPYAVWTGSFNFTQNAGYSFENAVMLRNPQIAAAYLNEYAQVYALSEPLKWDTKWVEPEYRIGS